jgi:hypothetical protein
MNAGWLPLGTGAAPQALPLRWVPLLALKAQRMPARDCGPQKEKKLMDRFILRAHGRACSKNTLRCLSQQKLCMRFLAAPQQMSRKAKPVPTNQYYANVILLRRIINPYNLLAIGHQVARCSDQGRCCNIFRQVS